MTQDEELKLLADAEDAFQRAKNEGMTGEAAREAGYLAAARAAAGGIPAAHFEQVLVEAVWQAARHGAEDMQRQAASEADEEPDWFVGGAIARRIRALPTPEVPRG